MTSRKAVLRAAPEVAVGQAGGGRVAVVRRDVALQPVDEGQHLPQRLRPRLHRRVVLPRPPLHLCRVRECLSLAATTMMSPKASNGTAADASRTVRSKLIRLHGPCFMASCFSERMTLWTVA